MNETITPEQYRAERVKRGLTQGQLAAVLGVSRVTISGRETGRDRFRITPEAARAIQSLPEIKTK